MLFKKLNIIGYFTKNVSSIVYIISYLNKYTKIKNFLIIFLFLKTFKLYDIESRQYYF